MYNKAQLEVLKNKVAIDYTIYQSKFHDLGNVRQEKKDIIKLQDQLNLLMAYFNKIVDSKRKEIIDKVVNLVSFGLQTIMDDQTIKLVVKTKLQRNQKFFEFQLEQDGEETPIIGSVGGGVVNLLSFLLHVVMLVVSSNRRFLVLDEPFANLSVNYRENIGEFLKLLAERTGVQFLIISHEEEITEAADVCYQIRNINNEVRFIRTK